MNFKNSVSLLTSNFSNTYKIMLYRIIVSIITLSLCAALILPNTMYIFKSAQLKELAGTFGEFFKDLAASKDVTVYGEIFNSRLNALFSLIYSRMLNLVMTFVWAFVILIVYSFLNGLSNFAFGGVINDHMSTLSHIGFTRCMIRNLKKACLYELVFVSLKIVYYVVAGLLIFYLFTFLLSFLSLFALTITVALMFGLSAFKQTVLGCFMPAMVTDDLGIKKSFNKSFKIAFSKKRFWKIFSGYLVASILITVVNIVFALFTFGTALFLTIPLSYMLLVAISFVNYYAYENKKYYINYDNIVVPKQLREEEKYLNEMDI